MIRLLDRLEPEYPSIINDPSRFEPAKSFMMRGRNAGFDMHEATEREAFRTVYNRVLEKVRDERRTVASARMAVRGIEAKKKSGQSMERHER